VHNERPLYYGDNSSSWLWNGLALIILTAFIGCSPLAMVICVGGWEKLGMMVLVVWSVLFALFGVFNGILIIARRNDLKITLDETRLVIGLPIGSKTWLLSDIANVREDSDEVAITSASSGTYTMLSSYFTSEIERKVFSNELSNRLSKSNG
jgi:hypothetical protein